MSYPFPLRGDADPILRELPSVPASVLKNNYGQVADQAANGPVLICRHRMPEMVLLSADDYANLQRARHAPLEALTAEFDAMAAGMNTTKAKRATAQFFNADAKQLGASALKAGGKAVSHAR